MQAHLRHSITVVVGIILALIFPTLWLTTTLRPALLEGSGNRANPPELFLFYHALPWLSQSMRAMFLLWMIGFFGALLIAHTVIPSASRRWRRTAVAALFLATGVFMVATAIFWGNPLYRHRDQMVSVDSAYHLLEAEYRSGPRYQIVVRCDRLGVLCQYVSEPVQPGVDGEEIDLREYIGPR